WLANEKETTTNTLDRFASEPGRRNTRYNSPRFTASPGIATRPRPHDSSSSRCDSGWSDRAGPAPAGPGFECNYGPPSQSGPNDSRPPQRFGRFLPTVWQIVL